jgi:uncharacterized membrane protein
MADVRDSLSDSQTGLRPALKSAQKRFFVAMTVIGAVVGAVVGGFGFGELRAGLLGMVLGAAFCLLATLGHKLLYQSRFRPPGKVVGALIWGVQISEAEQRRTVIVMTVAGACAGAIVGAVGFGGLRAGCLGTVLGAACGALATLGMNLIYRTIRPGSK